MAIVDPVDSDRAPAGLLEGSDAGPSEHAGGEHAGALADEDSRRWGAMRAGKPGRRHGKPVFPTNTADLLLQAQLLKEIDHKRVPGVYDPQCSPFVLVPGVRIGARRKKDLDTCPALVEIEDIVHIPRQAE